jgi:two-component system KDP operon response regulator KdpE
MTFRRILRCRSRYGRVITHKTLLVEVWGATSANRVEPLRTIVAQLRSKLGRGPGIPTCSEVGVGYRLLDTG